MRYADIYFRAFCDKILNLVQVSNDNLKSSFHGL